MNEVARASTGHGRQVRTESGAARAGGKSAQLLRVAAALNASPVVSGQHAVAARLQRCDSNPTARESLRPAPAPAQRRVIQRATIHIRPSTSKTLPGTISGVTFGRRPTSNSTIQGQHLTAYVAFRSMILSHTVDRDLSDAARSLLALLPKIREFINPKTTKTYLFDALNDADVELKAVITDDLFGSKKAAKKQLEQTIDNILSIRNKVPGSALATRNTGGHGESGPNGDLIELDHFLRRSGGVPDPGWDKNAVARKAGLDMWKLMDANPVNTADTDDVAAALIKHIRQMMLSFPNVFAWLSTNPAWYLRPLLSEDEAGLPLETFSKKERRQVQDKIAEDGW